MPEKNMHKTLGNHPISTDFTVSRRTSHPFLTHCRMPTVGITDYWLEFGLFFPKIMMIQCLSHWFFFPLFFAMLEMSLISTMSKDKTHHLDVIPQRWSHMKWWCWGKFSLKKSLKNKILEGNEFIQSLTFLLSTSYVTGTVHCIRYSVEEPGRHALSSVSLCFYRQMEHYRVNRQKLCTN